MSIIQNMMLNPFASGGEIFEYDTGTEIERWHFFKNVGTEIFQVYYPIQMDYIVVAGGGGGGVWRGGGGGAGGRKTALNAKFIPGAYQITVGAGGAGGLGGLDGVATAGSNGEDSSIYLSNGLNIIVYTATGGGGGGIGQSGNNSGNSGGSGGGAGGNTTAATAGSGTAGQGNDGGNYFGII